MFEAFRSLIAKTHRPSPAAPAWIERMFGIDLRTLALYRIVLGALLLADLGIRLGDVRAFYTDEGVLPRVALIERFLESDWLYSFHLLSGQAFFQYVLFAIAAAAAGCLMVGYRTTLAAWISFLFLCSLQNRNLEILQGGDALLRIMHFWVLFLPMNARWSVDARMGKTSRIGISPAWPNTTLSIASAACLLQIGIMYWFTAGLKHDPMWWRDGQALYFALSIDQFTTPFGHWLMGQPGLMRALSYGAYYLEAFGPFLAFSPIFNGKLRMLMVFLFMSFHLFGIGLTMELGLFIPTAASIWLLFLPAEFWDKWLPLAIRKFEPLRRKIRQRDLRKALGRGLNFVDGAIQPVDRTSPVPLKTTERLKGAIHAGAAAFCFLYALAWNVRATDFNRYVGYFPQHLNWIGEVTGLRQYWSMFSPKPMCDDGWYIFQARLISGEVIDLLTGKPVVWEKPALVSAQYTNQHWRKYLMNLREARYSEHRGLFLPWKIRDWNEHHDPSMRVVEIKMIYMEEFTTPEGTRPPEKIVLYEYRVGGEWEQSQQLLGHRK